MTAKTDSTAKPPTRDASRSIPFFADLMPVRDIRGVINNRLVVAVRNNGPAASGPSITRVVYADGHSEDQQTPPLNPDQMIGLFFSNPWDFSHDEFQTRYRIIVDATNRVLEPGDMAVGSGDRNNIVDCVLP
ncbi:MAG TPA: CARDB domain-containing protein [Symbiobacteriaceae bacterium]|nr:CARDB domain-containing protein [Symbiobacteriaceae bacterium]